MKKFLHYSWRIYKMLAITFFSVFCLLMVLVILKERFDYIELPNGVLLKKNAWANDEIILKGSSGNPIIVINSGGIIWNENYVAGDAIDSNTKRPIKFIYKVGALRAEIYPQISMFSYGDYEEKLKSIGLNEPLGNTSAGKTFWDLEKNPDFRRNFYEGFLH